MQDKKLLQIGEVAKIFHVSMGTLRHYEQEGLLEPEDVDEKTGYRYYGVRQLEVLNTIRYLRVLDLPLSEIAEFLHDRDTQVMEEKLVRQKEIIEKKRQELDIIAGKIDHRLEQLRDAVSSELDQIKMVCTPKCRIAWMKDSLKPESYLDLETAIRRLQKGQKEPLAFLGKVGVGISEEKINADGAYYYGEHGKPMRRNEEICFNLSHSGKYVLCAVSEMEIGCDIESITGNFWSTYGNGALRSPDFPGRSR